MIFGNGAVKSMRTANASDGKDPKSHVHISVSDKESGSVSARCGCFDS